MNNLVALCLAIMIFAPSAVMAHGGAEHESKPILAEPPASAKPESPEVVAEKTSNEMKIASGKRLAHEAVTSLKYKATFAVIMVLILMALLVYKYPSVRNA
ncbi:MAG TPA: hypothetical protein ENI77_12185 [Nitrospirae bacterium]|nr:hypothetical protein [Nitrospirota bacterium]